MRIETEEYLDFSQVLLKPKRSKLTSRLQANITRNFKFLYSNIDFNDCTPIIAANMTTVGTFETAKVLSDNAMPTCIHKFYNIDELEAFFKIDTNREFFYTMGSGQEEYDKYVTLVSKIGYTPNVCIDVANGYSESFVKYVSKVRAFVENNATIMAGNVATPEITEELILNGADIVKAGIGSGALCTTRSVTGVGIPQFSCVAECADAAHGVGGMLCSDGGITCPGDVVKAFGAGADFVMVGSEFAGHTENSDSGNNVTIYGMSSSMAQEKHYTENKSYRSSEGREAVIEFRGDIQDTLNYYFGGLRSGMTYIGAQNIKEIPKRATFIKVSKILNETHLHNTVRIK